MPGQTQAKGRNAALQRFWGSQDDFSDCIELKLNPGVVTLFVWVSYRMRVRIMLDKDQCQYLPAEGHVWKRLKALVEHLLFYDQFHKPVRRLLGDERAGGDRCA